MLKDFYQIISSSENEGTMQVRVKLNENHPIFAGHFPDQPVVPGVCMIQMVKELLINRMKMGLSMTNAKNIKFLAMLDPMKQPEVSIQIEWQRVETEVEVNAKIFDSDITFFKLESGIFLN